jgi:hypothetical protein
MPWKEKNIMQQINKTGAKHSDQRRRTQMDEYAAAHPIDEMTTALARLADEHTKANHGQGNTAANVSLSGHSKPPTQRPHKPRKEGWYIMTVKGNVGPFESREIVAAAERGEIGAGTELRHSRTGRLVLAGQVRGLISQRQSAGSTPRTSGRKQPLVRK